MRAALLSDDGRLDVGDAPRPEPSDGEVRIAIAGVGLCGSDLNIVRGTWAVPSHPWIPGHEGFGVINAIGSGVDPGRIGETVVIEPNIPCRSCGPCGRGWTSACTARRSVGMNRPGALAEAVVLPAANAWPAPSDVPEDLVCVEPLAVVEAALRRLHDPLPAAALVVGVGSQGLLMTLALRQRGVAVAVTDVNAQRMALAAEIGATVLDGEADDSYDLIVDTAGAPDVVDLLVRHATVGATVLELALSDRVLPFTSQLLVRRRLVVQGSLTYDHPDDFATTIRSVEAGIQPRRVVTDVFELEDVVSAFASAPTAPGKTRVRVGAHPSVVGSIGD